MIDGGNCRIHAAEMVTNYCQACQMLICPVCVEEHSDRQLKHRIMAIASALKKAGAKLSHIDDALNKRSVLDYQLEQTAGLTISRLEEMKKAAVELVSNHFDKEIQKISSILSLTVAPSPEMAIKIESIRSQLAQMHIDMQSPLTVTPALSKIFRLDHKGLLQHVLGKGQLNSKTMQLVCQRGLIPLEQCLTGLFRVEIEDLDDHHVQNEKGQIDTSQPTRQLKQQLAKHKFQEIPFKVSSDLHYIDDLTSSLYMLKKEGWKKYDIKAVPRFAATISLDHTLYMLGGITYPSKHRSRDVLEWRESGNQLLGQLKEGRSRFAIAGNSKKLYILGGVKGEGEGEITSSCEIFDLATATSLQMAPMGSAAANCSCTMLTDSKILKLGGVSPQGYNCNSVQIYYIPVNRWEVIDPSVEVTDEFSLISTSGLGRLSSKQVVIFGGVNEESDSALSKECYLLRQESDDWVITSEISPLPECGAPVCAPTFLTNQLTISLRNQHRQVQTLQLQGTKWTRVKFSTID